MKVRAVTPDTCVKPRARRSTKRHSLLALRTADLRNVEHILLCALLFIVGSSLIEQLGAFFLGLLIGFNLATFYILSRFADQG